ncbi:MAG: ATP-binding cassette domain-containing protein [Gemmataceae bacterium]
MIEKSASVTPVGSVASPVLVSLPISRHANCHPLLTMKSVHVALGGHCILHGLDAELEAGKITALVGLNGAGKSTLLRVLLGEVPHQGTIRYHCGHDHSRPVPSQVGYVPQKLRNEAHLPLTVADFLGLALQKRPLFFGLGQAIRKRMGDILIGVGAAESLLDRPVEKLSGGELQRVLLALAMEPHPELLLLDEPAAGIDYQDVERFYQLIAKINQKTGVTVLLVSHDLVSVSHLAHSVWHLDKGKISVMEPEQLKTLSQVNRELS